MPEPILQDFYTPSEVAARLRISHSSVCRLCKTGKIPSVQVGGRQSTYRIPREAFEQHLAASLRGLRETGSVEASDGAE